MQSIRMKTVRPFVMMMVGVLASTAWAEKGAPTTEDHIKGLQTMCSESQDARTARLRAEAEDGHEVGQR